MSGLAKKKQPGQSSKEKLESVLRSEMVYGFIETDKALRRDCLNRLVDYLVSVREQGMNEERLEFRKNVFKLSFILLKHEDSKRKVNLYVRDLFNYAIDAANELEPKRAMYPELGRNSFLESGFLSNAAHFSEILYSITDNAGDMEMAYSLYARSAAVSSSSNPVFSANVSSAASDCADVLSKNAENDEKKLYWLKLRAENLEESVKKRGNPENKEENSSPADGTELRFLIDPNDLIFRYTKLGETYREIAKMTKEDSLLVKASETYLCSAEITKLIISARKMSGETSEGKCSPAKKNGVSSLDRLLMHATANYELSSDCLIDCLKSIDETAGEQNDYCPEVLQKKNDLLGMIIRNTQGFLVISLDFDAVKTGKAHSLLGYAYRLKFEMSHEEIHARLAYSMTIEATRLTERSHVLHLMHGYLTAARMASKLGALTENKSWFVREFDAWERILKVFEEDNKSGYLESLTKDDRGAIDDAVLQARKNLGVAEKTKAHSTGTQEREWPSISIFRGFHSPYFFNPNVSVYTETITQKPYSPLFDYIRRLLPDGKAEWERVPRKSG